MPTERHDHATADSPRPRLSDDAVVQIHDFIAHFLDLFEARYGAQIPSLLRPPVGPQHDPPRPVAQHRRPAVLNPALSSDERRQLQNRRRSWSCP